MNFFVVDVLFDEIFDDWMMLGDGDVVVVDEVSVLDKLEGFVLLWEIMKFSDDESWEIDFIVEIIDIEEVNIVVGIVKCLLM